MKSEVCFDWIFHQSVPHFATWNVLIHDSSYCLWIDGTKTWKRSKTTSYQSVAENLSTALSELTAATSVTIASHGKNPINAMNHIFLLRVINSDTNAGQSINRSELGTCFGKYLNVFCSRCDEKAEVIKLYLHGIRLYYIFDKSSSQESFKSGCGLCKLGLFGYRL